MLIWYQNRDWTPESHRIRHSGPPDSFLDACQGLWENIRPAGSKVAKHLVGTRAGAIESAGRSLYVMCRVFFHTYHFWAMSTFWPLVCTHGTPPPPITCSSSSLRRGCIHCQTDLRKYLCLLTALHVDLPQKPMGGGLRVSLCTFMVLYFWSKMENANSRLLKKNSSQ